MSEKRWKVKMQGPGGLSAGPTIVLAGSRGEAKEIAKARHPQCIVLSASVMPYPTPTRR